MKHEVKCRAAKLHGNESALKEACYAFKTVNNGEQTSLRTWDFSNSKDSIYPPSSGPSSGSGLYTSFSPRLVVMRRDSRSEYDALPHILHILLDYFIHGSAIGETYEETCDAFRRVYNVQYEIHSSKCLRCERQAC